MPASASPITAITPSSYNLGVSVGWRRFAVSGDVAQADGGLITGTRESAQVGMSYRATRRLTGRVAVGAERAEGSRADPPRTRPIRSTSAAPSRSPATSTSPPAPATASPATGSIRSRDDRRDSQAVYVGTAFRF